MITAQEARAKLNENLHNKRVDIEKAILNAIDKNRNSVELEGTLSTEDYNYLMGLGYSVVEHEDDRGVFSYSIYW